MEKKLEETQRAGNTLLSEVVTEDVIAKIVSRATNIPVTRILKGDREKVLGLKETLKARVIGQDEAVDLVSDAIIRQRAGIKDQNRPIGSFLFLGPTGVGKTEVARSLAEALFDNENQIIRIDMSEYGEILGQPALWRASGYWVMRRRSVNREGSKKSLLIVLFDEIEKPTKKFSTC